MYDISYERFDKIYEGAHAVLFDCSKYQRHLAVGVWRGFFELSNQAFIDDMWRSIDFIRERAIVAIISDHSDLKVVTPDVLQWLHENWYANASKHGLRIEAALDSKSAVARLSLRQMLDEAKTGKISTPMFPSFDEAYAFCHDFIDKYQHAS